MELDSNNAILLLRSKFALEAGAFERAQRKPHYNRRIEIRMKIFISYGDLHDQVAALRLQALAAVQGLTVYVPPGHTRRSSGELLELGRSSGGKTTVRR